MSSLANRWARRRHARRRAEEELALDLRLDLKSGEIICSATRVDMKTRRQYIDDHYLLQEDPSKTPLQRIRSAVEEAERLGGRPAWRHVLLSLAHHRSEGASQLLAELEARVPRRLHGYWELAYAESVGWLGFEFIRDADGTAHVLPAGTFFRDDCDGPAN